MLGPHLIIARTLWAWHYYPHLTNNHIGSAHKWCPQGHDIWSNQEDLKWLSSVFLPTVLPGVRSPSLTTVLFTGTRHTFCLSLSGRCQFSTSLRNYLKETIASSNGQQRSPDLLVTTKPTSHGPYMFTLFPNAAPVCPHVTQDTILYVYVADKDAL